MQFILHQYALSPYSEKIRAMFGYTNIEWNSCITSEAPPRGKLDYLTGGYGRIPVAQLGSDIFCDTNIIADEIAAQSKKTKLANHALNDADQTTRQWFENKLFFACVNRAFSLKLLQGIAKEKGVLKLLHFLKDRIQMGAKASIPLGSPKSAPKHISKAMQDIEAALGSNDYIGGKTPSLLDFAAYHAFWFLTEVGDKEDIKKNMSVNNWYRRVREFRSRPASQLSIEAALEVAKTSKPRRLSAKYTKDTRIGSEVTITPNDYRQIPVTGTLVGADSQRWIIKLNQPETGEIHLHFPTHAVDVNIRLEQLNKAA